MAFQQLCREVTNMKISERNVLEGTVKEVKKGTTTSLVLIDIKGLTVTAQITNESVDEFGIKAGLKVHAIIKSCVSTGHNPGSS
jgi:molybdopterin-binding protein